MEQPNTVVLYRYNEGRISMADKKEKKVTIGELQTFIEAVEFTADLPDGQEWSPSARQWRKIREMIDCLYEKPIIQERMELPQPYAYPPTYNYPTHEGSGQPTPTMAPPGLILPSMAPVMLPPGAPFAVSEGIPVKTPNIDTTNGQYKSSFA